jgi:TolC family type I secretion outer membrane protein
MRLRRTRHSLLAVATGALMLATGALAFDPADPFRTDAITPPPPRLQLSADTTFAPCRTLPADAIYGVLEVVDQALCRNPKTHEAWASARVQAAEVGSARAAYLPDLDGKVTATHARTDGDSTDQRTAALTLSWLLYDFGARNANLENARQLLAAASSTLDATVQTVFLSALQSYYNAQAARAALTAAQESEKASRESLAAAETRYRVGTATPADRLQAQTAWSQAVLNRIKAEGTVKTTQGALANVIGLDASAPLRLDEIPRAVPDATFERDVGALIAEARMRRPDLQAAEAQVRAAQASADYARAAGRPTLSLSTGPSWQDSGSISANSNAIGLTLTLPLFSGFETTYRVRAAEARVDNIAAQRETLRQQVALDVWTGYQNLLTATHTIRTTADLLASAEQSERVALGRYKAGVGTILDVLNAQSALAAARVQRIQATLDWHVSRATLAKAVGTLDNRLLNSAADIPIP